MGLSNAHGVILVSLLTTPLAPNYWESAELGELPGGLLPRSSWCRGADGLGPRLEALEAV